MVAAPPKKGMMRIELGPAPAQLITITWPNSCTKTPPTMATAQSQPSRPPASQIQPASTSVETSPNSHVCSAWPRGAATDAAAAAGAGSAPSLEPHGPVEVVSAIHRLQRRPVQGRRVGVEAAEDHALEVVVARQLRLHRRHRHLGGGVRGVAEEAGGDGG